MKVTVARLKLLCVNFMVMSLMFVGTSSAEIDFGTCVGAWLFNEASGTVAEDSSGMGNNATIHGGAEWVDGMFGSALSLDGSDDYVEIAHDDSLNVGGGHTIALWFKLDTVPGGGMGVMTKDDWAPGFWWDATRSSDITRMTQQLRFILWMPLGSQIQTGIMSLLLGMVKRLPYIWTLMRLVLA